MEEKKTSYVSSSLEDDRFMPWSFRICKCTNCLCGFIVKANEHLVQAIVAQWFQEPFSMHTFSLALALVEETAIMEPAQKSSSYMYAPGNSFKALKHKQVSSTKTGPWTYTMNIVSIYLHLFTVSLIIFLSILAQVYPSHQFMISLPSLQIFPIPCILLSSPHRKHHSLLALPH